METDPTRMCELLVGVGEVELVGIDDAGGRGTVGSGDPVPQAQNRPKKDKTANWPTYFE